MLNFVRCWFIRSFTQVVRQYWLDEKCTFSIITGGGKFYIQDGRNNLVLFNKPYKSLAAAVEGVSHLAEFRFGNNYSIKDSVPPISHRQK